MTPNKIDLARFGVDGITHSLTTAAILEMTWFSDETSARLDDDQYAAGEGPVFDATAGHEPVLCPDLTATSRWPGFTAHALRLGVRAVFAFPMRLGSSCVGVMMCHRRETGPMSDKQFAAALALTTLLSYGTLVWNSGCGDAEGTTFHRAEVHQAAGILSHRLAAPVDDALARLRAYSFSHQCPITDVSRDIIAGRLCLPQDDI
ncbi:GAF domain-containing protein [Amycolatopsis thailandensis]|uniref:ANTAR domain-containing protein n=1 Tax=Amycolatopsis thailandensis TaxID=589330 RepID=UPI00364C7452